MKLVEIAWYIKCFVFNNLEFLFCEYVRMENPNDKSENIKRILKQYGKQPISKSKE